MNYCKKCGQCITIKSKRDLNDPYVHKLLTIMKRYDLTNNDLMKILRISKKTFHRWLRGDNLKPIKKSYFELLELKGYK